MSVEASTWARALRGLPQGARLALYALCNYAGTRHETWVSRASLADELEVTEDTVRTHLRMLADAGHLVALSRQRPNGSRTSDLIVLAVRPDRLLADVRALAADHVITSDWQADAARCVERATRVSPAPPAPIPACEAPSDGEVTQRDPPPKLSGGPPENLGGAPLNFRGPPELSIELSTELPPQPPVPGGGMREGDEDGQGDEGEALDTALAALLAVWPIEGSLTVTPDVVRRRLGRLSADDRRAAIDRAQAYRDMVARAGKHLCDLTTYLSQRRWTLAQPQKAVIGEGPAKRVFVIGGTPAFEAWDEVACADGRAMEQDAVHEGRRGVWRPSLFPPADLPRLSRAADAADAEAVAGRLLALSGRGFGPGDAGLLAVKVRRLRPDRRPQVEQLALTLTAPDARGWRLAVERLIEDVRTGRKGLSDAA